MCYMNSNNHLNESSNQLTWGTYFSFHNIFVLKEPPIETFQNISELQLSPIFMALLNVERNLWGTNREQGSGIWHQQAIWEDSQVYTMRKENLSVKLAFCRELCKLPLGQGKVWKASVVEWKVWMIWMLTHRARGSAKLSCCSEWESTGLLQFQPPDII